MNKQPIQFIVVSEHHADLDHLPIRVAVAVGGAAGFDGTAPLLPRLPSREESSQDRLPVLSKPSAHWPTPEWDS
jgi:hypothetical protein